MPSGPGIRPNAVKSGWASPTWNWGSARGDAHDEAFKLRNKLGTKQSRMSWLGEVMKAGPGGGEAADLPCPITWCEGKLALALLWQKAARERNDEGRADNMRWIVKVKLALALLWQKAARERTDGGRAGYGYVMEQLRLAKYEGSEEADATFVSDMESRLPMVVKASELAGLKTEVEAMGDEQSVAFKGKGASPQEFHRRSVACQDVVESIGGQASAALKSASPPRVARYMNSHVTVGLITDMQNPDPSNFQTSAEPFITDLVASLNDVSDFSAPVYHPSVPISHPKGRNARVV
eukprot:gene11093-18707_t